MKCCGPLRILNSFWLLLFVPLGMWAQVDILLHSHARWHRGLALGEIADISTQDRQIARFLSAIKLPDKIVSDGRVERSEIIWLLQSHMIDPKRVRVSGGPLLLSSGALALTKQMLLRAVKEYVKQNYPQVKIERILLSFHTLPLPKHEYRLSIATSSKTLTHIYLDVQIYSQGELLKRVRPTVLVHTYAKVPVAVRRIFRGKIIEPEDVRWELQPLRGSLSRYVKASELIGAVAKRQIEAGKVITKSAIEPDYAVKKRRSVKIVYQRGAIYIELLGLALQNGKVGDVIRVKNISTNKVLRCKVVRNGVVRYLY